MTQTERTERSDAGFSLLEALVALVILSVSAKAILAAAQAHTQSVIAISDRAVALWVAENWLLERSLGIEDVPQTVDMAGQTWAIRTAFQPTSDEDILRVDIQVGVAANTGAALAFLSGYIDVSGNDT